MILIALVICSLPALASAKTAVFTSCPDGVEFSDRLMQTQEGIEIINKWNDLKLVAWHKDSADEGTTCHSLSVSDNELKLNFKVRGSLRRFGGPLEVVHVNGRNNYIDVFTNKGRKLPTSTFGSGNDGKIRMYVYYLSETEMAFMTCRDSWLSSTYQFYVFSSHDYSHLDQDCLLETCENMDDFDMELAPKCQ